MRWRQQRHMAEGEQGHHQARAPWPLRGRAQNGTEGLLLRRRVPGITARRLPNTVPVPAPRSLAAAVWMSLEMVLVWKLRLEVSEVRGRGAGGLLRLSPLCVRASQHHCSQRPPQQPRGAPVGGGVETNLAQAAMFRGRGELLPAQRRRKSNSLLTESIKHSWQSWPQGPDTAHCYIHMTPISM